MPSVFWANLRAVRALESLQHCIALLCDPCPHCPVLPSVSSPTLSVQSYPQYPVLPSVSSPALSIQSCPQYPVLPSVSSLPSVSTPTLSAKLVLPSVLYDFICLSGCCNSAFSVPRLLQGTLKVMTPHPNALITLNAISKVQFSSEQLSCARETHVWTLFNS